MPKQYKSDALAAVHETAQGLADAGVMAKRTMRAFDEMCLTPVEDMPPEKIRALRLRENASQAVFARHLNVTAGLVSQWERGEKRPPRPLTQAPDPGSEERPQRGRVISTRSKACMSETASRACHTLLFQDIPKISKEQTFISPAISF